MLEHVYDSRSDKASVIHFDFTITYGTVSRLQHLTSHFYQRFSKAYRQSPLDKAIANIVPKRSRRKLNFILFIVSIGCLCGWSRIQDVKEGIGKNQIQLFYNL
jgi:hypothetical protein